MQLSRLFEIVYILMREKSATAKSLAERFEVSVRTIYRDVEALTQAGIPIYASRGRGGGLYLLDTFLLKQSLLTEEEQTDLLAALQGFTALGAQEAKRASNKLSALFKKQEVDWIQTDFSDWNGVQDDKFERIKTAILQKRTLAFTYCNANGDDCPRQVTPLKLWFKHRSWYLFAYCTQKQAARLFRLSRMRDLKLLGPAILPSVDMSQEANWPEQFPKQAPGQSPEQVPGQAPPHYVDFRFKLEKRLAYRVRDEFSSEQVTEQEDGSFLITMRCPLDDWIIGYFLSFGDQAEVLHPPYMRQLLIQRLQSTLQKYT